MVKLTTNKNMTFLRKCVVDRMIVHKQTFSTKATKAIVRRASFRFTDIGLTTTLVDEACISSMNEVELKLVISLVTLRGTIATYKLVMPAC